MKNSSEIPNILSQMSLEELNQYIYEIEKDYYECMPTDIMTFVNDPYYLGETYGSKLFDIWKKTLKEIYPVPLFSPFYEVILSAAIGAGKCLAKGTKILMYDSTLKNVEDIIPSNLLMGADNTPRKVISTCRGRELMYKVVLSDGSNFSCNKSHILTLAKNHCENLAHINVEDVYNHAENYKDYRAIKYGETKLCNFKIEKLQEDDYYGFVIQPTQKVLVPNSEHCFVANGIVTHNTTVSIIGMLYDIHKLFCLKNPQEYYGLTQNTPIAFSLFSATLSLATDVNWTSLVEALSASPYFKEHLTDSKVLENNAKTSLIPLSKNIGLQIGSGFKHTIGKAVFGSLLDEASFQSKTSENDQAQKTYEALTSRADSRFANSILINPLPGHQWLASSPKLATDFLARKINKSENRKGILIKKDIALWDAKPHLLRGNSFYVLVGDKEIQSTIVDDINTVPERLRNRLYKIPEMFRRSFEDDIDLAIMDKLGLSISNASNLFKTNEAVIKAMNRKNPFTKDVIDTLSFSENDTIMDYMDKAYFKNLPDSQYNRFIMLDAGVTGDMYGITGGYTKPISDDITRESGYAIANRTYYTDFSIGIKAVKGQRISFQKVKNFIMYLVRELGYPLCKVGADQFQSEDMLQFFQLKGFETEKISVVTDPTIYENTREAIETGSLFLARNLRLESELMQLRKVYVNRKAGYKGKSYVWEHPADFGKDIADTVAGFYKLASSYDKPFNNAKRIIDYFCVPEEEKTEEYYSSLSDEEFLEELERNKI